MNKKLKDFINSKKIKIFYPILPYWSSYLEFLSAYYANNNTFRFVRPPAYKSIDIRNYDERKRKIHIEEIDFVPNFDYDLICVHDSNSIETKSVEAMYNFSNPIITLHYHETPTNEISFDNKYCCKIIPSDIQHPPQYFEDESMYTLPTYSSKIIFVVSTIGELNRGEVALNLKNQLIKEGKTALLVGVNPINILFDNSVWPENLYAEQSMASRIRIITNHINNQLKRLPSPDYIILEIPRMMMKFNREFIGDCGEIFLSFINAFTNPDIYVCLPYNFKNKINKDQLINTISKKHNVKTVKLFFSNEYILMTDLIFDKKFETVFSNDAY